MPAKAKKQSKKAKQAKSASSKKKISAEGQSKNKGKSQNKSQSKRLKGRTRRLQPSRQENYWNEPEYSQGNQFLSDDIRSSRGGRGEAGRYYPDRRDIYLGDNDLFYGSGVRRNDD